MIIVNIVFKMIEIAKFSRGEPLVLKVTFNDGKERIIEKTTNLENVEEFTQIIINEARKISKEANAKNTGGFLDDVVQIRFGDDEEKAEEKLYHAFARVKEDVKRMRMQNGQNLLQRVSMIQGAKYNI